MSLNKDVIGGYSVDLFVNSPSLELICPICHDVFKNPYQCKNGHNFCLTCITQAVESHRECPVCKTFVAIKKLNQNSTLRNIVDQLSVKCKSDIAETFACHWLGKLADVEKHKSECTTELVSCPLHLLGHCNGCTGQIQRGQMGSHFLVGLSEDTPARIMNVAEKCVTLEKKVDEYERAVVPGHVVMKCENGDIYTGEMLNGHRHGQGTLQCADSDLYYSGGWKEGKKSGFGVEKCTNFVFSGAFCDDKRSGQGCFNYDNGDTFTSWKEGKKEGFGVYKWSNGEMYAGDWKLGLIDGYGTFTWPNGGKYEGHFKRSLREGYGKYSYAIGNVYEGNWMADMKSGDGVFKYADGSVYTGQFQKDKFHGHGTHKAKNGTITERTWKNGTECGH